MKTKTTKICTRKGCNIEFKLYRTTDKYCSFECSRLEQKSKPKPRQIIKSVSDHLKKELQIYNKKRKVFLAKPDNKYCRVATHVFNEVILTTDVHHKKGRTGKLLNYVPFWLAVSRKGHAWIHDNPEKSYQLGFLIRSTTINKI